MTTPKPSRVLMTSPDHFDVVYAINPYMKDKSGKLQKVDRMLATTLRLSKLNYL